MPGVRNEMLGVAALARLVGAPDGMALDGPPVGLIVEIATLEMLSVSTAESVEDTVL